MTVAQYRDKMKIVIEDKTVYRKMSQYPGLRLQEKVEKYLDKLIKYKFIERKVRRLIGRPYYYDPRLKGLSKAHNKDCSMGSRVDGKFSPCYFCLNC